MVELTDKNWTRVVNLTQKDFKINLKDLYYGDQGKKVNTLISCNPYNLEMERNVILSLGDYYSKGYKLTLAPGKEITVSKNTFFVVLDPVIYKTQGISHVTQIRSGDIIRGFLDAYFVVQDIQEISRVHFLDLRTSKPYLTFNDIIIINNF